MGTSPEKLAVARIDAVVQVPSRGAWGSFLGGDRYFNSAQVARNRHEAMAMMAIAAVAFTSRNQSRDGVRQITLAGFACQSLSKWQPSSTATGPVFEQQSSGLADDSAIERSWAVCPADGP